MGLLSLIKRISKGAYGNPANRLTNAEVDNNWQQIIDLFPTPASGNTDVGKTVVLNSAKTGFDYAPLPNGGVQSIVGGDNVTVDNTDPENPIINSSGVQSIVAGTNIIIDNSDPSNPIINATFSQEGKYLISGGAAWSGTGLTYDVTALTYFFNGNKISLATQVTLAVADPTNNRLDAIVVDEAGVVSVIQGTASVNPITPPIPEEQLLVQYILVEAGLASPSVSNENIYLDDPAGSWTLSTYTTGAPTGTLIFNGTTSPKEGINHIQANADQRLGARFVRTTSFDPYQYTMLSMWVRFTGSNVATNKSLNVRFENGAGALVANTINLFNFGLQRNLLNVWQLVVIPITSFGVLPTTVKGLKIIMAGGTVGQARQWDIDLISLTDNSVPSINEQVFNILKDGTLVGQSSTINFKGAPVTVTNDPINKKIDVEFAGGGGSFLPNGNEFITESRDFQASDEGKLLILLGNNISLTMPSGVTFTQGKTLGIYSAGTNNKFQSLQGGAFIEPYNGGEEDNNGEIVYLTVNSDGVNDILSSVSSAFVAGKTLNKYLYDKANRVVPNYIDDAAADADVNLLSGQAYTLTGSRVLNVKP